eukprot:COSAG02_NODE_57221_length_281_cov_1.087912_1_plen_60_part_00
MADLPEASVDFGAGGTGSMIALAISRRVDFGSFWSLPTYGRILVPDLIRLIPTVPHQVT